MHVARPLITSARNIFIFIKIILKFWIFHHYSNIKSFFIHGRCVAVYAITLSALLRENQTTLRALTTACWRNRYFYERLWFYCKKRIQPIIVNKRLIKLLPQQTFLPAFLRAFLLPKTPITNCLHYKRCKATRCAKG